MLAASERNAGRTSQVFVPFGRLLPAFEWTVTANAFCHLGSDAFLGPSIILGRSGEDVCDVQNTCNGRVPMGWESFPMCVGASSGAGGIATSARWKEEGLWLKRDEWPAMKSSAPQASSLCRALRLRPSSRQPRHFTDAIPLLKQQQTISPVVAGWCKSGLSTISPSFLFSIAHLPLQSPRSLPGLKVSAQNTLLYCIHARKNGGFHPERHP